MTAGTEGLVKIWNMQKELIREIQFTEAISAVVFLNEQADVLVGHFGKLSIVSATDYKPFEQPLPSQADLD